MWSKVNLSLAPVSQQCCLFLQSPFSLKACIDPVSQFWCMSVVCLAVLSRENLHLAENSSAVPPKDWKQWFLTRHGSVGGLFWEEGIPLPPGVAKFGTQISQIRDGSLTSNEQLLVYIIDCRTSQSEAAMFSEGKMRGRYLSKERSIFAVGDKQGCLSKRVGLRIEGNCW